MANKALLHARCGCGNVVYVKTLAAETSCPGCGWSIVYALAEGQFALSRHADFTVIPTKKRAE